MRTRSVRSILVSFLFIGLFLIAGCAKEDNDAPTTEGPFHDISKLPSHWNGLNPIGTLRVQRGRGELFCSLALTKQGYLVTAGHCVVDHKSMTPDEASKMTAYFQNPGDTHSTGYKINKLVAYHFNKQVTDDWALLKPSHQQKLPQIYGGVTIASRDTLRSHAAGSEVPVEAVVYDPDDSGYEMTDGYYEEHQREVNGARKHPR